MPAKAPPANDPAVQHDLTRLGDLVRARRKSMRIPAGTVARAANLSRQTLSRIEEGEPSVTIGAYLNALCALGLGLAVRDNADSPPSEDSAAAVELADYPQLKAWFDRIAARPAVQRAVQVLADARKPLIDPQARENLFGATQHQKR